MTSPRNLSGRQRKSGSLFSRVVISTVAMTAGVMVMTVLIVQLVLASVVSSNVDRELENRVEAVLGTITAEQPRPDVAAGASGRLEDGALFYDQDGNLEAGRVPTSLERAVEPLSTTTVPRTIEVAGSVRLRAVPFDQGAGGVVIVAEPLGPYERAELYALLVTIGLGVLVTLGAGVVAAIAAHRSLRPVAVMAQRADDWSEHDLSRRFELGPPTNELTALAATLDRLLDRVAGALRTERRLTADIAHELRTPLTAILGEAELAVLDDDVPAGQRAAFLEIAAAARRLDETVTTLVEVARTPGGIAGDSGTVGAVLDDLDQDVESVVPPAARDVALQAPTRLVVRALNPLLDNAARYPGTPRLSVAVGPDLVRFVVEDDGPGMPAGDGPFAPGASTTGGAGLGLALARRLARSVGGDVFSEPAASGARLVLAIPIS